MKRLICLLLCLLALLPCALAEDAAEYRGDGRAMLTVTAETALFRLPGEEKLTQLPAGMRLITTGKTLVTEDGTAWYEVYTPEYGYGCLATGCVQADESVIVAYRPGYGVSAPLFTVADPAQVRVEILSLDGLEYPVVTLRSVISVEQEDGSWNLVAAFDTAGDVCKTTRERVTATLYDLEGQPLEARMLEFHAPSWR